jgi:hypothetical protein
MAVTRQIQLSVIAGLDRAVAPSVVKPTQAHSGYSTTLVSPGFPDFSEWSKLLIQSAAKAPGRGKTCPNV